MEVDNADNAVSADEYDEFREQFEKLELSEGSVQQKLQDFQQLLLNTRTDDEAVKIKERCIYRLAQAYTELQELGKVASLLKDNGDFFSSLPKARTAKIVRNILNIVAKVPDSLDVQVSLCEDIVQWCKAEKRTFLRQRIEAKLASLLLQQHHANRALEVVNGLLPELKKLDDKQMLTEVHLTEARIYHALENLPKAKASLTASRTAANAIYVIPLLQAEIDEMSGVLLCEEGDYTTAYSYFLEAFDAYDQGGLASPATACLMYMVLCKVLKEAAQEVNTLLHSKLALKYSGKHLEAMGSIAKAAKAYSLEDFRQCVSAYGDVLQSDALIAHHLEQLYDKMLESNLLKILHCYSVVDIAHVAACIKLDEATLLTKLSQMILDHKLQGILDQGRGHLILYDSLGSDAVYSKGAELIGNMTQVVEALASNAQVLNSKKVE
eukprot:gene35136-42555_t